MVAQWRRMATKILGPFHGEQFIQVDASLMEITFCYRRISNESNHSEILRSATQLYCRGMCKVL